MGRIKRNSALEHAQNAQIQIILRMHKVSSIALHSANESVGGGGGVGGGGAGGAAVCGCVQFTHIDMPNE